MAEDREIRFDVDEQPDIRIEAPRERLSRQAQSGGVYDKMMQNILSRRQKMPESPIGIAIQKEVGLPKWKPIHVSNAPNLEKAISDVFDEGIKDLYQYEGVKPDLNDIDTVGQSVLGVTQKYYDEYTKKKGMPRKSVARLADSERRTFYKEEYADKLQMDKLPREVALTAFDYGVNAGIPRAARAVQRAVGVKEDGIIGPKTISAINQYDPKMLAAKILDDREDFYADLIKKNPAKYQKNAAGWKARIEDQRRKLGAGSYKATLHQALEVEKKHPKTSFPKSPELKMAFNPWYSQTLSGLDNLNAQIARIPAYVYNLASLPQNLIVSMLGRPDWQVEAPNWLVNNSVAKYYERSAELHNKYDERFGFITETDENWIQTKRLKEPVDFFKEGEWGEGAKALGWKVLENAPQQIMLLGFAGARMAKIGLSLMGAMSAAGKTAELSKREDLDAITKTINSTFTGTMEAVTEKLGLDEGFDAARKYLISKATTKELARNAWSTLYDAGYVIFRSAGSEFTEEAINEGATSFADWAMDVDKDAMKNLPGKMLNAGLIGAASGASMSAPSAVVSATADIYTMNRQEKARETYERVRKMREEGARYKQVSPLGFYSAVEGTLEQKLPASATADQIKGILKNTQGIKQEELDSLGVMEWLDTKPTQSKSDYLPYSLWHGSSDKKTKFEHFTHVGTRKAAEKRLSDIGGGVVQEVYIKDGNYIEGQDTGDSTPVSIAHEVGGKSLMLVAFRELVSNLPQKELNDVKLRAGFVSPETTSIHDLVDSASDTYDRLNQKPSDVTDLLGDMREYINKSASDKAAKIVLHYAKKNGIDGIKYTNLIEDVGSTSFIVFDSKNISTEIHTKFTKQEVLDFVKAGGVQLQEVVKGGEQSLNSISIEIYGVKYEELPDLDQRQIRKEHTKRLEAKTKFSQWQLAGGQNYREILLTLPNKKMSMTEAMDKLGYGTTDRPTIERDFLTLSSDAQREVNRLIEKSGSESFKGTHFDEPNILAHIRINDRETELGKTLFIEEVQSDWGQKGRDGGFASEWNALDKRRQELEQEGMQAKNKGEEYPPTLKREWADIMNKMKGMSPVPDMPFKKTESWTGLALKRILRYAAENGYDAISWTTGTQQVERYPEALRQVVDRITWGKEGYDQTNVVISSKEGSRQTRMEYESKGIITDAVPEEAKGKHISEVFGKTMAEKILASPSGEIEGKDFTVGGEGMKGFYDAIIPQFLNKYTKKWGGRVQGITIQTQKDIAAKGTYSGPQYTEDEILNRLKTRSPYSVTIEQQIGKVASDMARGETFTNAIEKQSIAAAEYLGGTLMIPDVFKQESVHALSITPSMREAILSGQPLFKRPGTDELGNEIGYEEEQRRNKEGREFIERYLPELAPYLQQPGALMSKEGMKILGDYISGRIRVESGQPLAIYKHEGFHAWFDAFVSPEDKIRIIDMIKESYAGSVKEYMDTFNVSEDRAAEEVLAELMEHVDNNTPTYKGQAIPDKIATFLKDVIRKIKSFLGHPVSMLEDFQNAFYSMRRDNRMLGSAGFINNEGFGERRYKATPTKLGGIIKQRFGGINPESIKKSGYNVKEDFQQFGLLYLLSNSGGNLNFIAAALAGEGLISGYQEGESETDSLMRALKTKQKNLERQELFEEWAEEYEEYANAEYESLTDEEKRAAEEVLRTEEARYQSEAESEVAERIADSFDENQNRIDDSIIIEDIDKKLKYGGYSQEEIIQEYADNGVEIVFHNKMIKISGTRKLPKSGVKKAIREATGQIKDEEARQLADILEAQEEGSKLGFKAGYKSAEEKIKSAKEILARRRIRIQGIRDMYGLTDADLRKINRKDIRLMSNYEFKKFIDDIDARAAEFATIQQLRNEVLYAIESKELQKVENLIEAMDIPDIKDMNAQELMALSEALEPFQNGDEFLSVRKLQTVKNTELAGIKTVREAKEILAKKLGVHPDKLNNIEVSELDKMMWDTLLAERNLFYQLLVNETNQSILDAEQRFYEMEKEVDALIFKARRSRRQGLVDRLVPTDKLVFEWLEADSVKKKAISERMTKEELALAVYLQARFAQFRDYLVQREVLKQYREDYITHIRRDFLETWKADGILTAFKEMFEQARQDEAVFKILDEDTQNILPLEKFFQFAMHRTGELKPSENVARAFKTYAKTMLKKQAFDKIVPSLEIYAYTLSPKGKTPRGLELDRRLIKFTREWINNKKGRRNSLGGLVRQGGVVDTMLRSINGFIGLMDLGLNIPVGLTTNIGEQVATYVSMGEKNYAKGIARLATQKGRQFIKDNRAFIGKSIWEDLSDTSATLGNQFAKIMFGMFHASTVNANKIHLLGSLTDQEWESGKISSERLAQIKIDMGRWRAIEGTKSIIGSTSLGMSYTKYKSWAIVTAGRVLSNINAMRKMITDGQGKEIIKSREFQELFRATVLTSLAMVAIGAGVGGDDDDSFIGEIIKKAKRELTTILGSLDPKIYFRVRMLSFLDDLAKATTSIHEGYKAKEKQGESKGINALRRIMTPKFIKPILKEEEKPKKRKRGLYATR